MSEQNRKTLRSFYCRDYLWELFEVMTRDLGCSMDYLINEAMRHYARSRNYSLTSGQQGGNASYGQGGGGAFPSGDAPAFSGSGSPGLSRPGEGFNTGAGVGRPGFEHRTFERMPAANRGPFQGGGQQGGQQNQQQGQQQGGNRFQVTNPPRPAAPPPPPVPSQPPSAPPAPPSHAPPGPAPHSSAGGRPQLNLIFNGQRYPISKDKFIIGRASQMTDLTIRDGNISRKHCAIIFRGGSYYIKDLDSTNGIEYKGSRIDSKKVEEGDVFHICDYELRFSYR